MNMSIEQALAEINRCKVMLDYVSNADLITLYQNRLADLRTHIDRLKLDNLYNG